MSGLVRQPGGVELAASVTPGGLVFVARGLGRCWVRHADLRWQAHPEAHLGSVLAAGPHAVTIGGAPRCFGDTLVGPTPTGRRGLAVVRAHETVVVHPSGAVAIGAEATRLVGAPGRTPTPCPVPLALSSVRFDDAGQRVIGTSDAGVSVGWRLTTRETFTRPGWPVHPDLWLDERGRVHHVDGSSHDLGMVEATAALNGPLLAGPGARVWDLRTGRAITAPNTVQLGVTAPFDDGFVTIHWETHEGWSVATRPWRFTLPLDPDDVPTHAVQHGDRLLVGTALGEGWSVGPAGAEGGRPERLPCPPPPPDDPAPVEVDTPEGAMTLAGVAEVDGRTYAWSSDGFLLDWISTPSCSGNS